VLSLRARPPFLRTLPSPLSASARFATERLVGGSGLDQFGTSPISAFAKTVRIGFVEVVRVVEDVIQ
jgi:hypothetical protein